MARSFNGSTDQIITSSFSSPAGGTLSVWLNAGSLSNAYNGLVGQATGANFFEILLKSTGKFAYYVRDTASGTISVDPGTASASGWTNVVMTYSAAGGLAGFVNGVSDGTSAGAGNAIISMSIGLAIGYDNGTAGRSYPGSIADAAEWNIVLSAGEIGALAKGARPGSIRPSSLMAWLPLDGIASSEPDLSGNVRNGTLTGTTKASGPPVMMLTPRWPQFTAASSIVFRRTLSRIGTRAGSRQSIGQT